MSRVKTKFGRSVKTAYLNQITNITVDLVSAPSWEELCNYLPEFTTATWRDKADDNRDIDNREEIRRNVTNSVRNYKGYVSDRWLGFN